MANELTINQISTVLNSIVKQATGQSPQVATNTSEFIAVANTALKVGYDPLINAISQVLSRTIFSIRPYRRKFGGIEVSEQKWGNITRKLNISDKDFENDSRLPLVEGQSVDMYKVNKPKILQTNFYGSDTYQRSLTIFRDQLDTAFSGPDEFARFLSMVTSNTTDLLEQARENLARFTIANFIAGKTLGDAPSCIHLLTEYNALLGLTGADAYTRETIYLPDNFRAFMKWVYARIAALTALMTERTQLFQINVTNKGGTIDPETGLPVGGEDLSISRHTPYDKQKVYLYAPARYQVETMVLADTYHDNYLRYADNETVNFWQSVKTPDVLNVRPAYILPTGDLKKESADVEVENIFGVIFDEEALGYTIVNQWNAPTPFNPAGGYTNIYWHETCKYWNDFTEKGIILLLD